MPEQKYRVLERIDAGGMAEVFRAVATSIEGFDKVVAIKRVLPSLTKKRQFVQMFLDEARVSLVLNHANIVQVFDLGHTDETYFIVMEYVEGTNLRSVLMQSIQKAQPIPVHNAVYIMAEVCKGLAYAHDLKDAGSDHLGIVHRDVSPPNVLLSIQGEVKLTDFGLAKAKSQVESTNPGFVKGKFSYLSPEAAYGEKIDQRTDIFAVGIVLWELLAARRLFTAETEQRTLERIRQARVPELARHNPAVPPELDRIVRRALSRDKSARYQTTGELGNDLTSFLFDHNLKVSNQDIADLVLKSGVIRGEPVDPAAPSPLDIEGMIQHEIDRFISLDEPGIGDDIDTGGMLEDPSTWFDGDEEDEAGKSVEVVALKVGPDPTSMVIPIDVVAQVVEEARARGGLEWLDRNRAEKAAAEAAARGENETPAAGPEAAAAVPDPTPAETHDETAPATAADAAVAQPAPPVADDVEPTPTTLESSGKAPDSVGAPTLSPQVAIALIVLAIVIIALMFFVY